MNNYLKAELWEIQVILYLILATQLDTRWVQWVIYIWCIITFIQTVKFLVKEKAKDKLSHKEKGEGSQD